MRNKVFSIVLVTGIALTACGGDDDGGGGSSQDRVGDMMVEAINDSMEVEGLAGVTVDEDCVREAAQELSDDDAQKILDAGPDGDPDVSASADSVGEALFACVDIDLSEIDLDG